MGRDRGIFNTRFNGTFDNIVDLKIEVILASRCSELDLFHYQRMLGKGICVAEKEIWKIIVRKA